MLENNNNNLIEISKSGVKTLEGKAISRYNAQKHSILRETATEYEKADVEAIYNDLSEELKPEGRLQEMIIETISSNAIRLQRISKAEAEAVRESISDSKHELKFSNEDYVPKLSPATIRKLDLYSRYQTATENRIYRALTVFKQLKTL